MNTALAAAHRQRYFEALGDSVALIPSGSERVRSHDTHYRFRPGSDFWYLTAFPEPDAVAVLLPNRAEGRFVLFVNPKDPEMETWNGRRAGVEGARECYGADEAHPIGELFERLPKLLKGTSALHYATGNDSDLDRKLLDTVRKVNTKVRDGIAGPGSVIDPARVLHELRLIKSADELAVMRQAAAVTDLAHRAAMTSAAPGVHEYEVEAAVDGAFRRNGGWGPGYNTIVAGGDNACVLHYTTNHMPLQAGELLLLDAGCEFNGYTADVTRTFPVSGRFSPAQRELYQVVLDAQLAAFDVIRPGARFADVHDAALSRLVQGLIALEFLPGSVDEIIEGGSYKPWYMHKTSHWLGIDVHDVGAYHEADGKSRLLTPGMVLTVEPGLYVRAADESAPERFRGTGVRIEDDVLVTAGGMENLTAAIPKTLDEVEAAC